MFCFADEYVVETTKAGHMSRFLVEISQEQQPFTVVNEATIVCGGHGTKLSARLTRNLPDADSVRDIISARFLHDSQFRVYVNGESIELTDLKGLME